MNYLEVDRMPVLDGEEVVGIIDWNSLVSLGKTRAEFKVTT